MLGPGSGRLAIWHDIAPGEEANVLEWYNREHHVERVNTPGFLRAHRHEAVEGSPRLFIWYGVADPSVLNSADYMARLNAPTAWTQRSQPNFRQMSRTVCRVVASAGLGLGGYSATARINGLRDRMTIETPPLSDAIETRAVVGAEVWDVVPEGSGIASSETRLRNTDDRLIDRAVVVTASEPEAAKIGLSRVLDSLGEAPNGEESIIGLYRLTFMLVREGQIVF